MNFLFMAGLGKTETESLVLGSASASADGLKALLPFFIWWAWQEKRRMVALAGSGVWVFFVGFSLLSAVGFSATNRGAVTDTREGLAATFETVSQDLVAAQQRFSALPEHRPAGAVQQAIEGLKQSRRWTSTRECTDATATASRTFCEGFFKLRAELATAVEANRLTGRIEGLQREQRRLREAGAGQDVDPQVSILSQIFGHGEDRVRLLLILVVAVLVELGSSLGLWLSTAHSQIFKRRSGRSQGGEGRATVHHETVTAPVVTAPPKPAAPQPVARQAMALAAPAPSNAPEQPPKPQVETAVMGNVEEYCLARLDPSSDGEASLEALRADYVVWCDARDERAHPYEEFETLMRAVAQEIEVPVVKGALQGLTIRDGPYQRAA